jgi:hypothetical protein
MTDLANSGALFDVNGFVSNGATWAEDIYFFEDGAAVDLTGLAFEFQFRECGQETATILVLSTADGELTIEADSGAVDSILRITVPSATIIALDGDYVADLVAKDQDDVLIHYAHGTVTFRPSPIAF